MGTVEESIRDSQAVVRFDVYRLKRTAEPASPKAYAKPAEVGLFLPISLHQAVAPDVPRLKARANPKQLEQPWRWRQFFRLDDRLEVIADRPKKSDRECPFAGFIVDVDWQFARRQADCIVTAAGNSHRLLADVPIYGRWMMGADEHVRPYAGLPCEFNAGGRPNRSTATGVHDNWHVPDAEGVTVQGAPLFTYDGDPAGQWWTPHDALWYLMWFYNAQQTWIANAQLDDATLADAQPIVAAVEGMSLWEAIAEIGGAGGYDVWESFSNDGDGRPQSTIRIQHKNAGPLRKLKHQRMPASGIPDEIDPRQTNLYSARVAESVASCITAPVVLGARHLREIKIELQPAWDDERLEIPDDGVGIVYKNLNDHGDKTYVNRYCVGGEFFDQYWEVGRLWDANTDGRYSDLGLTVPTLYGVVANALAALPAMPHEVRTCMSRTPIGENRRLRPIVTWSRAPCSAELACGWKVVPGRLAIYITERNLADVIFPHTDRYTHNLFYLLATGLVFMEMTATIAVPIRSVAAPARRPGAGTAFTTRRLFDRGAAGQYAYCVWGSTAETIDDRTELGRIAKGIQRAGEDRYIEAAVEVPWPEPGISLGDRIERIAGIEYPLAVNTGPQRRCPRVVAYEMGLTESTYDMQLTLDTYRFAGVV